MLNNLRLVRHSGMKGPDVHFGKKRRHQGPGRTWSHIWYADLDLILLHLPRSVLQFFQRRDGDNQTLDTTDLDYFSQLVLRNITKLSLCVNC